MVLSEVVLSGVQIELSRFFLTRNIAPYHRGQMPRNEDSQGDPSVSRHPPVPLVPVSAEVFAARKRRIAAAWIGAGVLVTLLAAWTYRRSVDPLDAQRAVDEGRRLLKATRYPE